MDQGFQKINLSTTEDAVEPQVMEASTRKKRLLRLKFGRRKLGRKSLIGLGLAVLFLAFVSIQSFAVYRQVRKVEAQAKATAYVASQQDIVATKNELEKMKKEVDSLSGKLVPLFFVKIIPFAGGYYSDVEHLSKAASHGIDAGIITSDTLIPYADVLGLKGGSSFTGGSAQDRIRTAVQTMSKVVPEIDKIEAKLVLAQEEMEKVNPKHYPNIGKLKQVRAQLQEVKDITDGAVVAVKEGKPLIKALPQLLGEDGTQKYLMLFQNDAELRPTGGFLTYYSVFKVEEGIITVDSSSDIYDLDNSIPSHPRADDIIIKYLPKVNTMNIRDINLSPDFIVSMDEFNKMYEDSSRYTEVNGIIAIDTQFFVNIIRILGEVQASGLTFTADNDPRCDCPQVVYELENEISRPVNYVKNDRKGLLADLMLATMDKALSSSPKEYWGRLFQQFVTDAQEKHIMFYMYNDDAQKGMEALNWAGKVNPFEGDYLNINDANFGGQKSNLFVTKSIRMDYNTDKEGVITKKVAIEYKNPRKHSDCNLESGGLCLNATLRNFQRMYVPKGSTLTSSKGSQVKVETKEDLGKTVFESFFTVNPLGKADMSYEYKLPFKLADDSVLPLMIQKQPGVPNVPIEIYVNGKKVQDIDLRTDTEVNLELN